MGFASHSDFNNFRLFENFGGFGMFLRNRQLFTKSSVLIITLLLAITAWADRSEKELAKLFESKPITIIVGSSPGGGYDTFSRLVARNVGKHLPGNPSFIVRLPITWRTRAPKYDPCQLPLVHQEWRIFPDACKRLKSELARFRRNGSLARSRPDIFLNTVIAERTKSPFWASMLKLIPQLT